MSDKNIASFNLKPGQVEWVVNDNGELGVKIGPQFFWLYKGGSFTYGKSQLHDDGTPIRWRPVRKREFGECCVSDSYRNDRDHFLLIQTVNGEQPWRNCKDANQLELPL